MILWPSDDELRSLYYDEGYTATEIAGAIGCSDRAVTHVLENMMNYGSSSKPRSLPLTWKVNRLDDAEFMRIVDQCTSVNMAAVCRLIGVSVTGASYDKIQERIDSIRANGI